MPFARWDNPLRKLKEHSIELPAEYLGFLLTMALQLSNEEVKLLMNFTTGKLAPKDVKEWVRVHETDLDIKAMGTTLSPAGRKTAAVHHPDGGPEEDVLDADHDRHSLR